MKLTSIKDFPILSSQRLILRQLELKDANAIFSMRSNENNNTFINRDLPKNQKDAAVFIKNINDGFKFRRWLYWGIASKELSKLAGTICLWHFAENPWRAEIGYEMHPDFQGKGMMQEAIKTVLAFGFETLELERIEAFTHRNNLKSIKVLEKNGFIFESKVSENGDERDKDFVIFKRGK